MKYKTTDYLPLLREVSPPVEDTVDFLLSSDEFKAEAIKLEKEGYKFLSFSLYLSTSGGSFAKAIWEKDCK